MSNIKPPRDDLDYQLLRQIDNQENTSQRALAKRMGISVGKVNYCLKAVIERGWVKVNNFRRADQKLSYAYLLTPAGVSAKLRLTRAFLARKEREFERLQTEIAELRRKFDTEQASK